VTESDSTARRLEVAGLAPLVAELSRRFEDGSPVSGVTVRDLDEEQREAIADLLGRDRLPGRTVELRVATLVAALGLGNGDELRSLVEVIVGPLGDRKADREERRRQRAQLWSWCAEQIEGVPLLAGTERAPVWVDQLRQSGVRGGDDGEHAFRQRLEQAVTVLRALPAGMTVSLASFADDRLADPHALDRGGALEGLVLDALSLGLGVERPRDAETVRQLWEQVGVVPDPLSSMVMVLGLRPTGDGDLAGWLRNCADMGEPAVVTLAQLRRWPMNALDRSDLIYVVENPSLISDAASGGWTGPPIVCSSGRPSVAVVTLIRQLGADGAACRQHADFDGAGLGITAWLADRAGTTPWLMTADAYRAAVAVERRRCPSKENCPKLHGIRCWRRPCGKEGWPCTKKRSGSSSLASWRPDVGSGPNGLVDAAVDHPESPPGQLVGTRRRAPHSGRSSRSAGGYSLIVTCRGDRRDEPIIHQRKRGHRRSSHSGGRRASFRSRREGNRQCQVCNSWRRRRRRRSSARCPR
jgi:uncharacterized protein (TIGR02679 family)